MALHHVLPQTWKEKNGHALIGGVALTDIAREYGTPAYVFDRQHLRDRLDRFAATLAGLGKPVYAAKAFWCPAWAEMVADAGWWADVVSVGEAAIARTGGVPAERTLLHGNLKTDRELALAVEGQVAVTVLDSPGEAEHLHTLASSRGRQVDVLVRLNEETGLQTHHKVLTSGEDAKFGMSPALAGQVVESLAPGGPLRLRGVHMHAGSHIVDYHIYQKVVTRLVDFVATHRAAFTTSPIWLNMGGGLAAPYLRTDPVVQPEPVMDLVAETLESGRVSERIGPVEIMFEPGRSLVANAGVLLYTVGVRKPLPAGGELLALDGGMTDNPRPGLYGSRYELLPAHRLDFPSDTQFTVFGRSCETDLMIDQVWLPRDLRPGEVVVMPAAGAYTFSMSSRYNLLPRPPVLFVQDGTVREVVSRETLQALMTGQKGWEQAESWSPSAPPEEGGR